jgi:SAM-dependent methyltransferase
MSISELERNDDVGVDDPTVVRRPSPPVELYAAGQACADELMDYVGGTGVGFERGRALDFGCGIGHVTQGLLRHFSEVDGVELSASMVELATSYNEHAEACRYHVSRLQHLRVFDDRSFDFVHSGGALQQMRPDNQLRFLSEFNRVLRPGGVAVFDVVPGYAGSVRRAMNRMRRRSTATQRAVAADGAEINFLRAAEVRLQAGLVGARVAAERSLPTGEPTLERRQFVVLRVS